MWRALPVVAGCLLVFACSEDSEPSLVLELRSELAIPAETNSLALRIVRPDGEPVERTYPLGTAPRDAWPQTVPILAGEPRPNTLQISAELRLAEEGRPSAVVGFGSTELTFPSSGRARALLEVARACGDADRDGFGVGFGCELPDCDDTRADVPDPNFCGSPPPGDGGILDGGVDPDGGQLDGGRELCGREQCDPDERCFQDQCLPRCTSNEDCDEVHLGCLPRLGVCICRVPCLDGDPCGPFECIDGCCRI